MSLMNQKLSKKAGETKERAARGLVRGSARCILPAPLAAADTELSYRWSTAGKRNGAAAVAQRTRKRCTIDTSGAAEMKD